ncbi:molybdenum cofactor guanylyltransferase MobA [Mycoplana rhizolycopersici]|uniref:Molybdenum cofactor guanylyltransferase n=1 Tax=Mycoplana rhizolycopersici TaxID=2746702 RepID=A0ABX2QM11_9HYPH|nr:molybdenum cofactor guanylyltransferase MobA [Rhizobium rhizolycopersici]NVP57947.1 molybdenum cofactor guanylyltransferase [Rhizobium rhizolycopersici]
MKALQSSADSGTAFPGVVLAGGRSSRMGRNKALLPFGPESLVLRATRRLTPQVTAVAINANDRPPELEALGFSVFSDLDDSRSGPLAGILASLRYAGVASWSSSHVVTVAIDSPFFPTDLVARLAGAIDRPDRIAVAASSGGLHPVFGLWPLALADDLEHWLSSGRSLRLRDWLARHGATEVHFADHETGLGRLDPFFNVNTPADLVAAQHWLGALDP